MPRLLLGPLLRHVDETTATVWVETDAPCEVAVAGGAQAVADTFAIHGHHYALVDVRGLAPGLATPYEVLLDGRRVWPQPDSTFPPPCIRTFHHDGPLRVVFGSCREAAPHDAEHDDLYGVDALRAYACRLAARQRQGRADEVWPTLLLLVGDQVYADSPPPKVRAFLAARRDVDEPPGQELANFEEYACLYQTVWSEQAIRWLLSTVPTAMLFDDHDIRDDWNTSQTWRQQMRELPWWRDRIMGGLASYWVYQHLGNLPPAERSADPMWETIRAAGGDAGPALDAFALSVDDDPEAYRWSYKRDFGATRLLALDSRCGRVLEPRRRDVLDPAEWEWFDGLARGGVDHLLIASSLPYLLPPSVHYAERWNEAVCDGTWGPRAAAAAERLRQGVDLEHWAAFQRSFDAMASVVTEVASGRRGAAPASVVFLSGDVHYSYLAQVAGAGGDAAPIYQAVCSPIRNRLPTKLRRASELSCTRPAAAIGRLVARLTRTPATPLRWAVRRGPWFSNSLATLDIDGRTWTLRWDAAAADGTDGTGEPVLRQMGTIRLP